LSENHRNKICQALTKTISDKLIDILKNAKITKEGTILLKADFKLMFKIFAEKLDEKFYMQIHDVLFLVEIFSTSSDALESFNDTFNAEGENKKRKYDPELIKIIIKKRKALNIK
jgi:hypothetical protein